MNQKIQPLMANPPADLLDGMSGACGAMQEWLVLYAAGELDESERGEVQGHTRSCISCAALLEAEERLVELVEWAVPEMPDANLLAICRGRFSDSLDRQEQGRWVKWLKVLFGSSAFGWRPAVTAALLIIVGFVAGRMAPWQTYRERLGGVDDHMQFPAGIYTGSSSPGQASDVAAITWAPAEDNVPPNVQVRLESKEPVIVQGTVNDEKVKDALLSVLQNGADYQPDVRLQSVELLKPRCGDDDVRQAMCLVLRTDSNPAVRLKALEALRGVRATPGIQQALLQTLREDSNPGVRVEAINSLMGLVNSGAPIAAPDDVQILRDSMRTDSNNYVRLQSAAILQDLNHASGTAVAYKPER